MKKVAKCLSENVLLEKQADKANFIPVMKKYWINYPPVYLYYLQNSQKAGRIRALIEFLIEKVQGKGDI